MRDNLLLQLSKLTKSDYLSDLHCCADKVTICCAIDKITPSDYSPEEWEDAVSYILGIERPHFADSQEAYQFLCKSLGMS